MLSVAQSMIVRIAMFPASPPAAGVSTVMSPTPNCASMRPPRAASMLTSVGSNNHSRVARIEAPVPKSVVGADVSIKPVSVRPCAVSLPSTTSLSSAIAVISPAALPLYPFARKRAVSVILMRSPEISTEPPSVVLPEASNRPLTVTLPEEPPERTILPPLTVAALALTIPPMLMTLSTASLATSALMITSPPLARMVPVFLMRPSLKSSSTAISIRLSP